MNPNDVIEAYVLDVMRRLPRKDRGEVGLELRGLLGEMLAARAREEGRAADDALALAVLRDFRPPAEIAARYTPPGPVLIPADQTRSFALLSIIGVALQWALTLPSVFQGQPLTGWWLTWGLGALWWPGFLMMMALVAVGVRQLGLYRTIWRARTFDPDRIHRGAMMLGLCGFALGVSVLVCLPWATDALPGPLQQAFRLDAAFLHQRAWPVLLLWPASFAVRMMVLVQGRWSLLMRRLDTALSLLFLAVMIWWLAAGDIFLAKPTDDVTKAALGFVTVVVVVELALRLYRRRLRFPVRKVAP